MKRQKGSLRAAGSLSVFQNPTLPGNPRNRYAIYFRAKKSLTRCRMKLLRQMQDIQDKIMRSFANSPPLAIWNFASRSETCRFFFSSPETS